MALDSIAKLAVIITGDTNPLNTAMRQGSQAVAQFSGAVASGASGAMPGLGSLAGIAGFAGVTSAIAAATAAAIAFGRAGIVAAAQMEQARISFEVMTGSAEKSVALMNELRILAAESPLNLMQIKQAAKVLMAMGEETGLVVDDIKMLGNVASGSGQNLVELAMVFGQVMQAGRLTGNELRQFNERGVPLMVELSEMLGKTKMEIRGMVEEGEIGSELVVAAFQRMTGQGGLFANMMERQTNTLIGQWEKLKENTTILASETTGKLVPALKEAIEVLNMSAEGWLRFFGVQRSGKTGDEAAAIRNRILGEKQYADLLKRTEEEREKRDKEYIKHMETIQKRADSITKSLRTPGEIFNDTVAELNNLLTVGLLGIESYQRGLAKARDDMEKAERIKEKTQRPEQGIGAVERFTMAGFSAVQAAQRAQENKPNEAEKATAKNTSTMTEVLRSIDAALSDVGIVRLPTTNLN